MAESTQLNKTLKLNNGLDCPSLGVGTCGISNVEEVVYQSIKDGTRLIDTAAIYKNEEEVGKGIKKAIEENIVKREDLFVVTKCWLPDKKDPKAALKTSLEKLKLDYVDLYLDHWPCGKDYSGKNKFKHISVREMWPKFESLVETTKAAHREFNSELGIICGFDYIYDYEKNQWYLLEYHSRPMLGDYSKRQGIAYGTKEERLEAEGRIRATALTKTLKKTR